MYVFCAVYIFMQNVTSIFVLYGVLDYYFISKLIREWNYWPLSFYIMSSFVLMSLDKLCYHVGYVNKIHVLKCRSLSKSENSKTLYRYYFSSVILVTAQRCVYTLLKSTVMFCHMSHLNLGCLLVIFPMDYLHQCTSLTGSVLTIEVNLVAQWCLFSTEYNQIEIHIIWSSWFQR